MCQEKLLNMNYMDPIRQIRNGKYAQRCTAIGDGRLLGDMVVVQD